MSTQSKVLIFIDDEKKPYGEYLAPINFELDTRKLVDGEHILKVVSKDPLGKEGIRKIPFVVRNGPSVAVEGLNENDIVDGVIPIMFNVYIMHQHIKVFIHYNKGIFKMFYLFANFFSCIFY